MDRPAEDGKKYCAISFDAAWGNEDTQTLIDILHQYQVKATFFLVGDWVDKYPESVKALSDGLRIDLVDTPVRVTNVKPGLVETRFSIVRYRGDRQAADKVYRGVRPLTGDDVAEVVYFAASVPEHIQVAEVLVMPTHQATGTIVHRE